MDPYTTAAQQMAYYQNFGQQAQAQQTPAQQTPQPQVQPPQQPEQHDDNNAASEEEKGKKFAESVKNRPFDHNVWTEYLAWAEAQGIETLRLTYTAFLDRFPLCFGYWKRFAELEQRAGNFEQAKLVFEQGITADKFDVNMWDQFVLNVLSRSEDPDVIRNLSQPC